MTSQSVSNPELSLIVPTYNEKENITPLLERIHKALSQYSYELIVVDDNSPDGTAELAKSLSTEYPLKVIVRTSERGLASAVVTGFGQARGAVLGVIDADLQHPPEAISSLLEAIRGGADVAIASRYVEGGDIKDWGAKRQTISKVAKRIAGIFLPSIKGIKDPLAGFFLFKRKVIDGAVLTPTGYKILLEVLVKGNSSQIVEVPYTFEKRQRGKSNLTYREQLNFLIHLARLMWFKGPLRRFVKFCSVGASGTFVYFALLTLLTEAAGLVYLASAVIAYEVSILNNFTWNELWTFRDRRSPAYGSVLNRGVKFNLVSLGGFAIHYAVLLIFTEVVGVYYVVSAVIAIAFAMFWNFFVNLRWTWGRKHDEIPSEQNLREDQ